MITQEPVQVTEITKRSGESVPYEKAKIAKAVWKCLVNSKIAPDNEATSGIADQIAEQVDRLLPYLPQPVTVEVIQDLVEQQLMAAGMYKAAKEYILYREGRKKQRKERPIPSVLVKTFQDGISHFNGPNKHIQAFQAFDKFARFDWEKGRREVWPESVRRVIRYAQNHIDEDYQGCVDEAIWDSLERSLLNLEASPALRVVQMAGPALERCQTGVYNCSFQFLRS